MIQTLPTKLQGVLWSRDIHKLDIQKDKIYIIHQILSHGRMEDLQWLLHTYTHKEVIDIFTTHPYKEYDAARFHFVKNFLLELKEKTLEEKQYVKNTPRNLG